MSEIILEGNIAIATMLGWIKQFNTTPFVEVKDEEIIGYIYAFDHLNYSRTMTGKFQFAVEELRFNSDQNWMGIAIDFIHKIGTSKTNVNGNTYEVVCKKDFCSISSKFDKSFSITIHAPNKTAVFCALAEFSKFYIKNHGQ